MTTTYWRGASVLDGIVSPLEGVTNWKSLVERAFEAAIQVRMTNAEFLALPPERKKHIKNVPYLTPCAFNPGTTKREDSNASSLVLAFLDIDEGEAARPFFHAPNTLFELLGDLNFCIYTTISHTPDTPKLRIVVPLNGLYADKQVYTRIIRGIAKMIGLPLDWKGWQESTVISQPMFRPCTFSDSTTSPVLASRWDGRNFSPADVDESADLTPEEWDADRDYAAAPFGPDDSSGLGFLPIPDLSVDTVRELLGKIDPDCSYYDWFQIVAGLKHQFAGDDAKEAYQAFDEWSSQGGKYPGEANTYRKWRQVSPYPKGRLPITIRSVLKSAVEAGWNPRKITEPLEVSFKDWVAGCDDATALTREGIARLRAIPLLNQVEQEILLNVLRKRINRVTGGNVNGASMSKLLRQADIDATPPPDLSNKPAWLRGIVYVTSQDKFVDINELGGVSQYTTQAFDRTFSVHLMDKGKPRPDSRPPAAPSDWALNTMEIPRVDDFGYDPSRGKQSGDNWFVGEDGKIYLNTYRPNFPDPDPSTAAEAGEIFTTHLGILCGLQLSLTMLDWIAHKIQHPEQKIHWAPLIQSAQGAGKGLTTDALAVIMGKGNVVIVSNEVANSGYNDAYVGVQLAVIEELHLSGQNRSRVSNALKEVISNKLISINQKYRDSRNVVNYCDIIGFTNHHDGASMEASERRYFVVKSPLQSKRQVLAKITDSHIKQMVRLQNDLAPGLRSFLETYPISPGFDPTGHAPQTEFLQEVIDDSKSEAVIAIEDLIEDPEHPLIGKDIIVTYALESKMIIGGKLNRYLRQLGFVAWDRNVKVALQSGARSRLWVQRGWDVNVDGDPAEIVAERDK